MREWIRRILISREEARKVKNEVYSSKHRNKDEIWTTLMILTIESERAKWYFKSC